MNPDLERRRLLRGRSSSPRPALFLDRDGVLIEDRNYLKDPAKVQLIKGARTLLEIANSLDWPVVLVTNQSGIARGYFNWNDYDLVTERMLECLGPKAILAGIYANGHGPKASAKSWRKPSPGMLFAAAKELNLDLHKSILVGDRLSDMQAGARANLRQVVHVLSGHGNKERAQVKKRIDQNKQFTGELNQPLILLLNTLANFPLFLLRSSAKFSA